VFKISSASNLTRTPPAVLTPDICPAKSSTFTETSRKEIPNKLLYKD
jgi:hypothetical protein